MGGRRAQGRRRQGGLRDAARRRGTARPRTGSSAILFDVFANRRHHATELPAIKPTVAEILREPGSLTFRLPGTTPTTRSTATTTSSTARGRPRARGAAPAGRWCCTTSTRGTARGRARARSSQLARRRVRRRLPPAQTARSCDFLRRVKAADARAGPSATEPREPRPPVRAVPGRCDVRRARSTVMPRLEALAVVTASTSCTNDDLIRNAAYNWSPMTADEIRAKTGIEERRYTARDAGGHRAAGGRGRAGRTPGAGRRRSAPCWSARARATRLIPSRGHVAVAGSSGSSRRTPPTTSSPPAPACPTASAEATRLLQEVRAAGARGVRGEVLRQDRQRPHVADDLRRRRGGDRRRPGRRRRAARHRVLQTYASGPVERGQLDHLAQPRVRQQHHRLRARGERSLAGRYLDADDRASCGALPDPDGRRRLAAGQRSSSSCPHQANKTMVIELADAGRAVAPSSCTSTSSGSATRRRRASRWRSRRGRATASSPSRCASSPRASAPARSAATR